MLKDTLYMSLTTGAKLLSGILSFVLMARGLGPENFGLMVYAFALATIVTLIIDYGFVQQLLRELGKAPARMAMLVGDIFVAKLALTLIAVLVFYTYFFFFEKSQSTEQVFWLLLIASSFASFSEFFNASFRCVGKYKQETNLATLGAVLHLIFIGLAVQIEANVYSVAAAFVASRFIYLILSWVMYKKYLGGMHIDWALHRLIKTLKSAFSYAADAGVTNLFYQIDTIIVTHYLGFSTLGYYQAASRWLQGAMQFAPVLANVYVPKLAAVNEDDKQVNHLSQLFNSNMLIAGLAGGLIFGLVGPSAGDYIYGERYAQIADLWLPLGVLLFCRYLSGSLGTLLMVHGHQKIRVYIQIAALLLLLMTAPYLVSEKGIFGMLLALQLNVLFVACLYAITLYQYKYPNGFNSVKKILLVPFLILMMCVQF